MPTTTVGDGSALGNTALTPDPSSDHNVAGDTFFAQFVSAPMASGNAFVGGTTFFRWALQGLEAHAANNLTVQLFASVVSEDGNTVRQTLLGKTVAGPELNTSLRSVTSSPTITTGYTTATGDRLVIEISVVGTPGGGGGVQGHNATLRFGSDGAGGDLPNGDNTQTGTTLNPWIELANLDLTFAGGSQTATPGAFSLAYTAATPTVTASDHKTATPGPFSLTYTAAVPTVTASDNKVATPGAFSLAYTPAVPTVSVSDNKVVTPGAFSLAFTPAAPTVATTANTVVTPGAFSLAFTPAVPTVTASDHKIVEPGAFSLAFTPAAPTVTVGAAITVEPGAFSLAFTPAEPTVTVSDNKVVTPGAFDLVITMSAPTVTATVDEEEPAPPPPTAQAGGAAIDDMMRLAARLAKIQKRKRRIKRALLLG